MLLAKRNDSFSMFHTQLRVDPSVSWETTAREPGYPTVCTLPRVNSIEHVDCPAPPVKIRSVRCPKIRHLCEALHSRCTFVEEPDSAAV